MAELREVVARVERPLAAMEERIEATPESEDRLYDVMQGVIQHAQRSRRRREKFNVLVRANTS